MWYERMTENVARRGWRKSPTQTPDEFVARIEDAAVRQRVAEFTRHYKARASTIPSKMCCACRSCMRRFQEVAADSFIRG